MKRKVPTFPTYLTSQEDTPPPKEGHSLASKSSRTRATPKGLGSSTGGRVRSGWVGGQKSAACRFGSYLSQNGSQHQSLE